MIHDVRESVFMQGEFKGCSASMRECFVRVGLRKTLPGFLPPHYRQYTGGSLGTIQKRSAATGKLSTAAAETDLVNPDLRLGLPTTYCQKKMFFFLLCYSKYFE